MASSVDPDQTAPIGAVCSGSTLLASILNSSVMLGNHFKQTTSADDIFRCIFFLGALRVKHNSTDCLECLFCEDAAGTKYTTVSILNSSIVNNIIYPTAHLMYTFGVL